MIPRRVREEKLHRFKGLYRVLEITEGKYRQEVLLTQAKLSSLVNPEQYQVVSLGDNVEGVVAAWEIATKEAVFGGIARILSKGSLPYLLSRPFTISRRYFRNFLARRSKSLE